MNTAGFAGGRLGQGHGSSGVAALPQCGWWFILYAWPDASHCRFTGKVASGRSTSSSPRLESRESELPWTLRHGGPFRPNRKGRPGGGGGRVCSKAVNSVFGRHVRSVGTARPPAARRHGAGGGGGRSRRIGRAATAATIAKSKHAGIGNAAASGGRQLRPHSLRGRRQLLLHFLRGRVCLGEEEGAGWRPTGCPPFPSSLTVAPRKI